MQTDRRKFIATTASLIGGISLGKLRIGTELNRGNYIPEPPADLIRVSLSKRISSDIAPGSYMLVNEIQEWNPMETAVIICDMWDNHWCRGASERVAEMAPFMNTVVNSARQKGVLIIHAPSSCMDHYKIIRP